MGIDRPSASGQASADDLLMRRRFESHVYRLAMQATGRPDVAVLHVRCEPVPHAELRDCFATVQRHVATHGGQQVLGWDIWEIKGLFIQAEFHAVWKRPDGRLLDIAAHPVRDSHITFVPDPHRFYQGSQVDNARASLCVDPDVQRWLDLHAQNFALVNEGQLKHSTEYRMTKAIATNERDIAALFLELARRYPQMKTWPARAAPKTH